MSYHYAKEKFKFALMDLVAAGDIYSRVASALSQHLQHIKEDEDLPDAVRKGYVQLRKSLNIEKAPGGHVVEIINNMSEFEVEKVAQHIVELYTEVIVA